MREIRGLAFDEITPAPDFQGMLLQKIEALNQHR
jgi:hypothetical protein